MLKEEYHFSNFVGERDFDKAFNLLAWVNRHFRHTGNYDNSDRQDALTLLKLAFDSGYPIGVSNVITEDDARITVREGDLLFFHTYNG